MNLPNKITLVRICFIPLIIIIPLLARINPETNFLNDYIVIKGVLEEGTLGVKWFELIVLLVFMIASITDFVDGHLARTYGLVTDLGKFLDPLADKLLMTASMLVLMELNRVSAWVVAIILAREFVITGFRSIAISKGVVIAASKWGKAKTLSQMLMVGALFINNWPFSIIELHGGWHVPMNYLFIGVALALTLISGIDYLVKNRSIFYDSK